MTPRHPELGTTLTFEPSRFPFDTLFLERIRNVTPEARDLADLSLLHRVVGSGRLGAVYDSLYALVRERPFRDLYLQLVRETLAPHFDPSFRFQRVPGIRIHPPSSRTVQYHSDFWYGHGPSVVNFWMPLTRSFGTNALFVATLEDSSREIELIVERRLRQPEIDERLQAICKPVEMTLGGIRVFNAQTAHGSLPNATDRTRISMDFRVLMGGTDPGSKNPREYYVSPADDEPFATTSDPSREGAVPVGSYIFPKHGFTRFIPATSQRAVVHSYAEQKKLRIVTEETEIFPMTHHPTLLNLAAGKGADEVEGVLLFSVMCLPEEAALRNEVYEIARAAGTTLFFANENLVFPVKDTEADLESARARSLES